MTRLCVLFCLALSATAIAQQSDQSTGELNARDVFWSASDLAGKRPPTQKSAGQSTSAHGVHKAAAPTKADDAGAKQVSVHAPLGLRYSVLKKLPDGTYREISPSATFHAGDRIRLSLMSNQEGYLYVIEQGSSGKWLPLYPSAGAANESNKLTAGNEYMVPGSGAWTFTGDPGQEKLFVLLSRAPEVNLDETIAALKEKQGAIDNDLVAQLRSELQSRDLVFASGDDTEDPTNADKANYVVNKATTKPDPHVVVDVVLSHK